MRWSLLVSVLASVGVLVSSTGGARAAVTMVGDPSPSTTPLSPDAPADVPDTLVPNTVTAYTVAAPKVFWHTRLCEVRPPSAPEADQATNAPSVLGDIERVSRIAVQGSITRSVYVTETAGYCTNVGRISSNVVADADYVYWATPGGLMRLSTNANPGDTPQVFNGVVKGAVELAIDGTYVFALVWGGSSSSVYTVLKSTGAETFLSLAGQYAGNLQVSYSYSPGGGARYFLYWLDALLLRRYDLNATSGAVTVMSGIVTYHADGGRFICSGFICSTSDLVYASTSSTLLSYSNVSNTVVRTLYNIPTDPQGGTYRVYSITSDQDFAFFLLEYRAPGGGFGGPFTDYVQRIPRSASNATTADTLYTSRADGLFSPDKHLTTANDYLLWQEDDKILRLPNNAAALLKTNLRITGMAITQGIQNSNNTVQLVQNKRTFVRLFVQSDGPGHVSGVTARLNRINLFTGEILGSVYPINSVGTNLTVRTSPQRKNLNDSFLFELPWDWINGAAIALRGELNPYHAPVESGYGDNTQAGVFGFGPSPRLQVQFVAWGYDLNGSTWYPRFIQDVIQTYSWIRRTYPLASTPGLSNDPTAGFRPGLWYIGDSALGSYVNQQGPMIWLPFIGNVYLCQVLYAGGDPSLCASRYTNIRMDAMRTENGLPQSLFFYGMISDAAGVFPRGQACCAPNVSSGPVGSGTWGWDSDGSYADWYAGHEIGHTLGRGHPDLKVITTTAMADGCGLYDGGTANGGDAGYWWPIAHIGQTDGTEGFDPGDPSLGIPRAIHPGTQWHDMMSYCNNQWVGDYTYTGIYNFMNSATRAASNQASNALAPRLTGDWLAVYGSVISGTNAAVIDRVRHVDAVSVLPLLAAGGYAIRLLDGASDTLAEYAFTPGPAAEDAPNALDFTQVVTFAAGTRKVNIVRLADNATIGTANVSANPPSISGVALQGAPDTVTGTVTLDWTASDPDGDALKFDIFYSRDNGATLQPLLMGVSGNSAQIDTARLGGGAAIVRVIASDGANTAFAGSAPFSMANKPPQPRILTPEDGLHLHYGQLANFGGQAEDFQDGSVTGAGLVWTTQLGVLGTGATVSSDSLPVGVNVVTLTAANSQGLSASASITVTVDDNLDLLGPTLTTAPAQFGWSFAAGATEPQTDTLEIGNAGSGDVNWTASTDAPWLTLSASSGVVPASIVLTADPAGVPSGSTQGSAVTIVVAPISGQPAQTVTIPVNMAVGLGYVKANPGYIAPKQTFVPIVLR